MAKIDYAYKSKIMKTGLCKKIGKIDYQTYKNSLDGIIDRQLDNDYFDLLLEYNYEDIKEARKINHATFTRATRLKKRIAWLLMTGKCIFATLTFTNDVLDSTSSETRRKYVTRYLKSISDYYVANVDFGSETEREHYHAVIMVDFIDTKWDYGFTFFEKVRLSNNKQSEKKLADYIAKLTNHGIKETTRRQALIFSRFKRSFPLAIVYHYKDILALD